MLQMQDSLNRNSLAARDETTEVDRQQDLIEKLELRLQREVQVHANMHSWYNVHLDYAELDMNTKLFTVIEQ